MDQTIYIITLVGTALVLAAAFTSVIAFRFGAPLLLVFLLIGLLAGVDGLGINFDNAPVAYFVGSMALTVVLFDSGFGTQLRALRQAAAPALVLSTLGVVLTASLLAAAAHLLLGLDWLEAFLLGAIVGSTDAAAVFFLLRTGNVTLRDRVRATLEIESGSNDPIAIFLTLALVGAVAASETAMPGVLANQIFIGFLKQMGIGAVVGLGGGWVIIRLVQRLSLDRGLVPIFVIALSFMVFGIAGALGGSGFLAVYLAGIIAGNRLHAPAQIKRFLDGMTWLAQIVMFLVLGLFATPSQFPMLLVPAVLLALFLMLIARPLAVAICLAPFRFPRAETAFVSWVGLRGAVSILLALTPLIGRIEDGRLLFNVAFIIVMASLLIQGWTILPLARRLGLVIPPQIGPVAKHEVDLPGSASHELLAYRIAEESPVARGTRIPRWARPALVVRDNRSMTYQHAGRLRAGDHVYIFVSSSYPQLLDRLFASPAEVDPDDVDFFGAFSIDPSRPVTDLRDAYDAELGEAEAALTIAEMVRQRLGGTAEYADRLPLSGIELIVREADENGEVLALGLSVDPEATSPRIPAFLSLGELGDRLRDLLALMRTRWREVRRTRREQTAAPRPEPAEAAPQPDKPVGLPDKVSG